MSESATDTEDKTQVTSAQPTSKRQRERPPFKSCFLLRQEAGRSNILPSQRGKQEVPTITPKFYSRFDSSREAEIPEAELRSVDLKAPGPKERYERPVVESHNYGWDVTPLIDVDTSDRRLHHAKRTSDMIKVQFLINCSKQKDKTN